MCGSQRPRSSFESGSMDDSVEIVAATAGDLDAIQRIEAESFPEPWRRHFFEAELVSAGRLSLVARERGKVVAYLFAMTILDEMHINKIAVAASHRREGIAGALMARLLELAVERGIRTLMLEVRRANSGAQLFYRQLGFEAAYIRPRYYPDGEAAVVMVRKLVGN